MVEKVLKLGYRGYRQIPIADLEILRDVRKPVSLPVEVEASSVPDIIQEIFAPDPLTGNPSSDFYIRASADSDVRDYIDKYLMQQVLDSPRTSDSQTALDFVKSRYESAREYADRLRSMLAGDAK